MFFYLVCMLLVSVSTSIEIVSHRLIKIDHMEEFSVQCIIEMNGIWRDIDTILLFVHHLTPFVLYVFSLMMIIRLAAQSRSSVQQESFLSALWIQIKKCRKQLICPILMIISSLPQLVIGFSVDCDQWHNLWLRYLILASYLTAHTSQWASFVLFIYPSENYKKAFQQTLIGKRLSSVRKSFFK